jgi:hypothetical protein
VVGEVGDFESIGFQRALFTHRVMARTESKRKE